MAKYKGWNDNQLTEALKNRKKTESQLDIVSIQEIHRISKILFLGKNVFNLFKLQWKATQLSRKNPEADKLYKKKTTTTFDRLYKESELKRLVKDKLVKDKEMAEIEQADEWANTYKHLKNNKPRTVDEFMDDQKAYEDRKQKNIAGAEPKEEYSFRPEINPTSKKIVELR